MYDKNFWLKVAYIIILVGLTACYIFGNVIQIWSNWISGLAYGLAISGFMFTLNKKRRGKSMDNSIFWRRIFYLFIIIALTLCYIFGDTVQSWRNWFSGLAYGFALNGLLETLNRQRSK